MAGPAGLRVELWEHARPASQRIRWIERLAILGKDIGRSKEIGPRMLGSATMAQDPTVTAGPPT